MCVLWLQVHSHNRGHVCDGMGEDTLATVGQHERNVNRLLLHVLLVVQVVALLAGWVWVLYLNTCNGN